MSSTQNIQNLKRIAKFYKKNRIDFSVIADPTQLATSFPVAISQTVTFTYTVTAGRTFYITDFSMNVLAAVSSSVAIEIPTGTIVYRLATAAIGVAAVQFKTPLVAQSGTDVRFNVLSSNPTYNVGGYEV